MNQQTFSNLLERYLREDLSREEAAQLLDALADENMRGQWEAAIGGLLADKSVQGLSEPGRMDAVRRTILARRPQPLHRKWTVRAAAAAVILLLGTAGIWLVQQRTGRSKSSPVAANVPQITPGGDRAVLTLADGSRITLDSAGNGAIANQGNVQVVKLGNGQLAYNAGKAGGESAVTYNTLSTPRGGQFKIILPDGSSVWLNAASTLRFPTAFAGQAREVQLSGEAYFEVAKNPAAPFAVKVNNMTVKVLGTHFNVMAYPDERSIQTTLLEGAVDIRHGAQAVLLKPGQQASLNTAGDMQVKNDVDVAEVVAWKNGYFHFNHEPLEGVMRQISRWYDAEVSYEGQVPDREFGGKIARASSVTDVLKILELSRVHYRIEGKKIIITP